EEVQALNAFVHLIGRPALRTVQGKIPPAPPPWPELDDDAQVVNNRMRGIGRLDSPTFGPEGTGWFVAPGLLMTNNHVVAALCGISVHTTSNWRSDLDAR